MCGHCAEEKVFHAGEEVEARYRKKSWWPAVIVEEVPRVSRARVALVCNTCTTLVFGIVQFIDNKHICHIIHTV